MYVSVLYCGWVEELPNQAFMSHELGLDKNLAFCASSNDGSRKGSRYLRRLFHSQGFQEAVIVTLNITC